LDCRKSFSNEVIGGDYVAIRTGAGLGESTETNALAWRTSNSLWVESGAIPARTKGGFGPSATAWKVVFADHIVGQVLDLESLPVRASATVWAGISGAGVGLVVN